MQTTTRLPIPFVRNGWFSSTIVRTISATPVEGKKVVHVPDWDQLSRRVRRLLKRNPADNLLMTSLGMVDVDLDEPDRHLSWIKNQNREIYRKQIKDKKKQSELQKRIKKRSAKN